MIVVHLMRAGGAQWQLTGGEHVLPTIIHRRWRENLWGDDGLQLFD